MANWIDVIDDLDLELLEMTEEQLHEFATTASTPAADSWSDELEKNRLARRLDQLQLAA